MTFVSWLLIATRSTIPASLTLDVIALLRLTSYASETLSLLVTTRSWHAHVMSWQL